MSKDSKLRDIDLTTVDCTVLGEEHIGLVTEELGPVAANFGLLGSALRINHGTMKNIRSVHDRHPVEGLQAVVEAYLTLDYDNVRHGSPSWWRIITAVSNSTGGNNHALAKKIAKKFYPGSMTPSISNSAAQMAPISSTEETRAQIQDVTARDYLPPWTQHYPTQQMTNNPPYTPGDSHAQTRPRVLPGQSTQPANPNHPHHSQSDTALYQHQHLSGTTSLPPGSVSPHVAETRRHLSEPDARLSQRGQGRGGLSPLPEQTGNANVQQQGELPTSFSQTTQGPPQPNTAQLQLCFNPQTQTIEQCYVPLDVLRGQFQFCQVFDTQTQTVIQCYVPIIALQRQLKFCQVYNPQTRTFVQCHIPIPIPQGQPHGQPHPSAPNSHNMPTAPGYGHNIPPDQHNTPRMPTSRVTSKAPPTTLYPPQTSPHPQEHQTQHHHGRTELIAGRISPTYAYSTQLQLGEIPIRAANEPRDSYQKTGEIPFNGGQSQHGATRGVPSGGDLSQQGEVHRVTTTAHQPESMSEGAPDRRAMVGISRSPDIHSEEVDSPVCTRRLWPASGASNPYRHGSQSPHPPLRRTPTPGDQYDPNRRTPPPGGYGNQGSGYSNRRTPPPGHQSDNTQSGYFPGADYKCSPHEGQFISTPVRHNSGGFSHTCRPPTNQGGYVTPQAGQIPTNTPGYHGNQLPGYPPTQSAPNQLADDMSKMSMKQTLKHDREYTQVKAGPQFSQQQPYTQASGRQPGPDHYPTVSGRQPPPGSQSGHQYQQVEQQPPPPVIPQDHTGGNNSLGALNVSGSSQSTLFTNTSAGNLSFSEATPHDQSLPPDTLPATHAPVFYKPREGVDKRNKPYNRPEPSMPSMAASTVQQGREQQYKAFGYEQQPSSESLPTGNYNSSTLLTHSSYNPQTSVASSSVSSQTSYDDHNTSASESLEGGANVSVTSNSSRGVPPEFEPNSDECVMREEPVEFGDYSVTKYSQEGYKTPSGESVSTALTSESLSAYASEFTSQVSPPIQNRSAEHIVRKAPFPGPSSNTGATLQLPKDQVPSLNSTTATALPHSNMTPQHHQQAWTEDTYPGHSPCQPPNPSDSTRQYPAGPGDSPPIDKLIRNPHFNPSMGTESQLSQQGVDHALEGSLAEASQLRQGLGTPQKDPVSQQSMTVVHEHSETSGAQLVRACVETPKFSGPICTLNKKEVERIEGGSLVYPCKPPLASAISNQLPQSNMSTASPSIQDQERDTRRGDAPLNVNVPAQCSSMRSSVSAPQELVSINQDEPLNPNEIGGSSQVAQCTPSLPNGGSLSKPQDEEPIMPSQAKAGPSTVCGHSGIHQETLPEDILGGHSYGTLLDNMDQCPITTDGGVTYKSFKAFQLSNEDRARKKIPLSFGLIRSELDDRLTSRHIDLYPMDKRPHGLALVISNEKFFFHKTREGTSIDESNLIITLRYLGYNVEVYNDLHKNEMCALFRGIKDRDLAKCDSFVCCILTHGDSGKLVGSDSESVVIDTLTRQLCAAQCPQLKEKPKIFFIQACRGLSKCSKVAGAEDTHPSTSPDSSPLQQRDETDYGASSSHNPEGSLLHAAIVRSLSQEEPRVESDADIPDDADFFFGYATPPGQVSWRDANHGSWYISELCRALCTYGFTLSLSDIIVKVHREVGKRYEHMNYKQQPETTTRLVRKVFF